jgi:hypothetical protein
MIAGVNAEDIYISRDSGVWPRTNRGLLRERARVEGGGNVEVLD